MPALKQPPETAPAQPSLGHTIRSWWMLMAEASLGEDLAIMAETGLTLPQVLTLFRLHDHSPQCVSSIAAVLYLSQPATSQLLDRLVQERLVDRTEDPGDRRRKRLAITPRGARLVTRLADAKSRGLDHAANSLSPQVQGEARLCSAGSASPAGPRVRRCCGPANPAGSEPGMDAIDRRRGDGEMHSTSRNSTCQAHAGGRGVSRPRWSRARRPRSRRRPRLLPLSPSTRFCGRSRHTRRRP